MQKKSALVNLPKKLYRRAAIFLAALSATCFLSGCITHAETSTDAPERAGPSAESAEQGAKLLDKQCLGCHLEEKLRRYRKNRDQWDRTIVNMMRGAGVKLTEEEKAILLDYMIVISTAKKAQ